MREAVGDVSIENDVPMSVFIFGQCRKGLHPVAGIEVMYAFVFGIIRMMDVSANDSVVFAGTGKFGQGVFKVRNIVDGGFHFLFYMLRKRIIRFAVPYAVTVVETVESQQDSIAEVTQKGEPFHLRRAPVKYITVSDEVTFAAAFQFIVFHDAEVGERERSQIVQEFFSDAIRL